MYGPMDQMQQNRPIRFRRILAWLVVSIVIALTAAGLRAQTATTGGAEPNSQPVWAGGSDEAASPAQESQPATPEKPQPASADAASATAEPAAGDNRAAPVVPVANNAADEARPAPVAGEDAGEAPAAGEFDDQTVATVNGQPVERKVLVDKLLQYYGQRALDSIIQQMVIIQEAERLGLEATGKEIDEALDDFYRTGAFPETMPMSRRRSTWNELLKGRGLTLDDFREDLRVEVLLRKLAERRVQVTDEMIRDKHAEMFGERLMISWILLSNEAEAREVSRRLASGAEFETLARQVSSDAASAAQGGRLSQPIARGRRGAAFDSAVFSLETGEISLPVRTGRGWAVVRLDERIAADDVPLEKVRDELRAMVAEEAQASMRPVVLQELLRKAKITRRPLMPAGK